MAYRQLTGWCWGWLGKKVRVVLPAVLSIESEKHSLPHHELDLNIPPRDQIILVIQLIVIDMQYYYLSIQTKPTFVSFDGSFFAWPFKTAIRGWFLNRVG